MGKLSLKLQTQVRRKNRIRKTVSGTTERPRLVVNISNLHVSAQVIDDTKSSTIVAASTVGSKEIKGNMTEKAKWVGTQIAKLAKKKGVSKVVYDRSGKKYHGRVKALADAARAEGLEF